MCLCPLAAFSAASAARVLHAVFVDEHTQRGGQRKRGACISRALRPRRRLPSGTCFRLYTAPVLACPSLVSAALELCALGLVQIKLIEAPCGLRLPPGCSRWSSSARSTLRAPAHSRRSDAPWSRSCSHRRTPARSLEPAGLGGHPLRTLCACIQLLALHT
jgi:hypothetical protein